MEMIEQRLEPAFLMGREIGHSLGTPLAVVLGNLTRMKNQIQVADDMDLAMEDMLLMTRKCVEIQQKLSSISRSVPVQKSHFDIFPEIQLILDQIFSCSSKIVVFENKSEFMKIKILGHSVSFVELLEIILQNAFDFTSPTGKIKISFSCNRNDGQDQIHFIDDGCGIDSHIIHKIFDPFFTTKPFSSGHGLSLTRAAVILKSHGGRIDVWQRNQGTEFMISIPK